MQSLLIVYSHYHLTSGPKPSDCRAYIDGGKEGRAREAQQPAG